MTLDTDAAVQQSPGPSSSQQVDLSRLSLEQLERLKEKAREKQWEDEWWKLYMKKEEERKSKLIKEYQGKEKEVIIEYNITLTRCERLSCLNSMRGVISDVGMLMLGARGPSSSRRQHAGCPGDVTSAA